MEGFNLKAIAMTQRFLCSLLNDAAHEFHMKMVDLLPVLKDMKYLFLNFSQNKWAVGFDLLAGNCACSKTLWFGRDAFWEEEGRSLLVHWPTLWCTQFNRYIEEQKGKTEVDFWEELSCGVYSVSITPLKMGGFLTGEVKKHEWTDFELKELITWERTDVEPKPENLSGCFGECPLIQQSILSGFSSESDDIDLLNVSFDGESAPDRTSARAGLKELQKIAPSRRWNLLEIDADLQKLTFETKHVMALTDPAKTYMLPEEMVGFIRRRGVTMAYNINVSNTNRWPGFFWWVQVRMSNVLAMVDIKQFRNKSWLGLHEEMKLDMHRIWKRNLGRDDRCMSDNGKEARFPFLDEDVIRTLLDIPLWEIAELDQLSGIGDKKILREVA